MRHSITRQDFYQWRTMAQVRSIASGISLEELDWFLLAVTNCDRLSLRLQSQQIITSEYPLIELEKLWEKRITEKIPVQYLIGKTPWRNFQIQVSPAVLIPRPETEYLIDLSQKAVQKIPELNSSLLTGHWVDLGTGSGAIALGLADSFPDAKIHAVDNSKDALAIAKINAKNHQLEHRIQFYHGSWWQPLTHLKGQMSGMISNPPYIPTDELPNLQAEVYHHEPHTALDGGEDGLKDIKDLVQTAPDYLIPGGIWLIEMMLGQGQSVAELLNTTGQYYDIQIINDFAACDRYVLARRR